MSWFCGVKVTQCECAVEKMKKRKKKRKKKKKGPM